MVSESGKKFAIASLVLGICALVLCCFGIWSIGAVVLGIVGLAMASKARTEGFAGGLRTAGFVCSLIGLVLGGIVLVFTLVIGGAIIGAIGAM